MVDFNAKPLKYKDSQENLENQSWWEKNPMTYDWDMNLGTPTITKEYFKAIDKIFGDGHSLLNNPNWPKGKILERFIPYQNYSGKNVLEIGCGAGLVSSNISESGANLFAIDLTSKAIEITRRRFDLFNLSGNIQQMDAEDLTFDSNSMDYVVSWGVIHHSGDMESILSEIHRVLRPGGKAFIMVYNRNSIRYQVYCRVWLGVFKMKLFHMPFDKIVGSITDGHIARHLVISEFKDLAKSFDSVSYSFSDEKITIMKYLFGLGAPFKQLHHLTRPFETWLASRWGWYLQAEMTK